MVRVISGKYRGRALATLLGNEVTRPTADMIKGAIFSIIASRINLIDAYVVDLFSGSGALGIEALSRGAKHVIFVENHPSALQTIRNNLKALNIPPDTFLIVDQSVDMFLASPPPLLISREEIKTKLILADPPYSSDWYSGAIARLEKAKITAPECLFILEMGREKISHAGLGSTGWQRDDSRMYGKKRIEIWRKIENSS